MDMEIVALIAKFWTKRLYSKHFAIYRYGGKYEKSILVAINLWEIIALEKYLTRY